MEVPTSRPQSTALSTGSCSFYQPQQNERYGQHTRKITGFAYRKNGNRSKYFPGIVKYFLWHLFFFFFFPPWMGEKEVLINLLFLLQQQGSVVQWDSTDALHLLPSSPPSTVFEEITGCERKQCCWSSQRAGASHNYRWNEASQRFAPWKETSFGARRRAVMGLL